MEIGILQKKKERNQTEMQKNKRGQISAKSLQR
jgi:hypothetical protein